MAKVSVTTNMVELLTGRRYHLKWARSKGMCWVLVSYDLEKGTCLLSTPKTKKKLMAKIEDLYNTNKNEARAQMKAQRSNPK